jgi:hypothetical protein
VTQPDIAHTSDSSHSGHESRITSHASRVTHHESRITSHASRVTHHESRITSHGPSRNQKSKFKNAIFPAPIVPKLCPYFVRSRMRRSTHDFAINDLAHPAPSFCHPYFCQLCALRLPFPAIQNQNSKIQNPKFPAPIVPKLCPYFVRSHMRRSSDDFAINDLANSAPSFCHPYFCQLCALRLLFPAIQNPKSKIQNPKKTPSNLNFFKLFKAFCYEH